MKLQPIHQLPCVKIEVEVHFSEYELNLSLNLPPDSACAWRTGQAKAPLTETLGYAALTQPTFAANSRVHFLPIFFAM